MHPLQTIQAIDSTIASRSTLKVFSPEPLPETELRSEIDAIVAAAGWAPFHKPADKSHRESALDSPLPFRCYKLDAAACRSLRRRLLEQGDTTKIPPMLAAADALIQVTWLPIPSQSPTSLFDSTPENLEHVAAAAAGIQNLLLAATARGIPNYWSSGGALRSPETFAALGIPARELLLGALFLFPRDIANLQTAPGALRPHRGAPESWSRWTSPAP